MTNKRTSDQALPTAVERNDAPNRAKRMTRQQLQDEAVVIESLLSAAMAYFSTRDEDGAFELVSMANGKAKALQLALDIVNQPEGVV